MIVERADTEFWRDKNACWWAICDCGGFALVRGCDYGKTVNSCGCLRRDMARTRGRESREKISQSNTQHGHARVGNISPTYQSWKMMKIRCTNPNRKDWPHYGGRGITVCDSWMTFENFLADMGERPAGMSLDRIDVNGNYEPGNCRWADDKTQRENQRPRTPKAA